jgi:hypothetical protein
LTQQVVTLIKQTNKQTNRQASKQAGKQTDKQIQVFMYFAHVCPWTT